ncbi:hypothetical protein FQA39_LY18432 [Lamprigera yunnana]|nr:hypothetical protein FQA39_LY18432 [Lamprigera yunnana]
MSHQSTPIPIQPNYDQYSRTTITFTHQNNNYPLDLVLTCSNPSFIVASSITTSTKGIFLNGSSMDVQVDHTYPNRLNFLMEGPTGLNNDDGMIWCGMLSQPEYVQTINRTVDNYDVNFIIQNVEALSEQYEHIISELHELKEHVKKIGTPDDVAKSIINVLSELSNPVAVASLTEDPSSADSPDCSDLIKDDVLNNLNDRIIKYNLLSHDDVNNGQELIFENFNLSTIKFENKLQSTRNYPVTPPASDNEDQPPLPQNNMALAAKRRSEIQRKLRNKVIKKQKYEIRQLRQKVRMYQKKLRHIGK